MTDNELRERAEELFRKVFEMEPGKPIQPRDHHDVILIEHALRDALATQSAEVERLRRIEAAATRYCEDEPPCHCGEFAPGPCCTSCRNERELRAALALEVKNDAA